MKAFEKRMPLRIMQIVKTTKTISTSRALSSNLLKTTNQLRLQKYGCPLY
jgi:hypothetical protein